MGLLSAFAGAIVGIFIFFTLFAYKTREKYQRPTAEQVAEEVRSVGPWPLLFALLGALIGLWLSSRN